MVRLAELAEHRALRRGDKLAHGRRLLRRGLPVGVVHAAVERHDRSDVVPVRRVQDRLPSRLADADDADAVAADVVLAPQEADDLIEIVDDLVVPYLDTGLAARHRLDVPVVAVEQVGRDAHVAHLSEPLGHVLGMLDDAVPLVQPHHRGARLVRVGPRQPDVHAALQAMLFQHGRSLL